MRPTAVALLVALGLCCTASLDASGQQATANTPAPIAVSPALQQMLQKPDSGPVTELSGFVGQSLPDSIRLYWDRSLTRYWDIPRADIVQHIAGSNPNDAVKIYVRSSAAITTATRVPAETGAIQRAIVDGLGNIPIEGTPVLRGGPSGSGCAEHALVCVIGHMYSCALAVVCGAMQK